MPSTTPVRSMSQTLEDLMPTVPKNVGHLLKTSTEIVCPACSRSVQTRVEKDAVTCFQRTIAILNCLLLCDPICWSGRFDINHYCSHCGCYIGRHITLSWYKRKLFLMRSTDLDESDNRWQNFRRVEVEQINKSKRMMQVKAKKPTKEVTQTTTV